MADATGKGELTPDRAPIAGWELALANVARNAGPPLLFGLRLWAAVCLATYVAFWLELDNAFWAPVSAALVCQPHLGASLRKGWFRMIGTVVGAVAIVVLTACFPQDRFGFLVSLALWGGVCALVATLLHNFASYAAALAGYTAAIIASDQLGATGGPNGEAFTLAITRVSEIWIGIVCAGIVLAGTDFGGAPRRLAAQFAGAVSRNRRGFASTLALAGFTSSDTLQPVRRELIRRVTALDPAIDEAIGESSTAALSFTRAADRNRRACLPRSPPGAAIVTRLVRYARQMRLGRMSMRCCAGFRRRSGPLRERASRTPWMAEPSEKCRAFDAAASDADSDAGRHAVAATACRPDGGRAHRLRCGPRWIGLAGRRSRRPPVSAALSAALRARLVAGACQWRARVRDDRRGRNFLDRDRMAERRVGHHLRSHCGDLCWRPERKRPTRTL